MVRGFVLLGCLVTVPSAAVLGTSLPRAVRSVLEGDFEIPAIARADADDSADAAEFEPMPLGEAPLPPAAATALTDSPWAELSSAAPLPITSAGAPSGGFEPRDQLSTAPMPRRDPNGDDRAAFPALADAPAEAVSASSARSPGFRDVGVLAGDGAVPRAPGALGEPVDVPRDPAPGGTATHDGPLPNPPAAAAADPFAEVQRRLRSLGAVYYLLETWGDRHERYRFYCRVAVGGNPAYTRHFEATDTNPLRAMGEVVRQVEQWHRGALP